MVNLNALLFVTDRCLEYVKNRDFLIQASKVDNSDEFSKLIESKTGSDKKSLENAIIYMENCETRQMSNQSDLNEQETIDGSNFLHHEDFHILFLEKYRAYIPQVLEKNVMEYFNNDYISYCFCRQWQECTDDNKDHPDASETEVFNLFEKDFYGKSMNQIFDLIDQKNKEIVDKIKAKTPLNDEEQRFFENIQLNFTINGYIAEDSYDEIVEYFNLYPIRTLDRTENQMESLRNRQLFFIYMAAKRIREINPFCLLSFDTKPNLQRSRRTFSGFLQPVSENEFILQINYMQIYDISNDEDFYQHLFTLFHEIGHLKQHTVVEEPEKNIYDLEHFLMRKNYEFYRSHHNQFQIEINADLYAINEMKKEFGKDNNPAANKIYEKELENFLTHNVHDVNKFMDLEIEEYNRLKTMEDLPIEDKEK